jgi:polyamine oxidase
VYRLFFAGEATSAEVYGYLHGAYFEGKAIGELGASCVGGTGLLECQNMVHYETLFGSTPADEYVMLNG